jgi:AAA domain, putative AbiEii toxin, Type IV TA system
MIIRSMRILNYKCFDDYHKIVFGERLNLIVGQNNAGKTAVFDCLDFQRFTSKPHRGLSVDPFSTPNPISTLEMQLRISGNELYRMLMDAGDNGLVINLKAGDPSVAKMVLERLFETDYIDYDLNFSTRYGWIGGSQDEQSTFQSAGNGPNFRFIASPDRSSWQVDQINGASTFAVSFGQLFSRSAYVFKAERLNVGQCAVSSPAPLATDASNLAACIQNLQANPSRFARFASVVREILPSVKWVSAHVLNQSATGISIWNASVEREDLRVGLEDSGTGVGQILSIIYAVMESTDKKILAIDEPNSFLHPAASRKLMDVLTRYDHQYIISTHSPEVIGRCRADTLHVLKRDDNHTAIQVMDSSDVSSLKGVLSEVGVHLSDLLGPDAIIWVEGQTEQECFPLLFKAGGIELPRGVSFIAVLHNGDFDTEEDRATLIFRLYERISHANALVPPALAFVFDREGRSERNLADLDRRGSGRVKLLPRMMYENYLIDPEAISQVLCKEANSAIVTEEKITEWLRKNGGDAKYYPYEWEKNLADERWLANVNSAKLLYDMFGELTNALFIYRKTTHSVALTEWLIERHPERLTDLMEFVRGINLNYSPPISP